MAAMRGSRLPVGSTPWITEERAAALQITQSEVEEFSFSARNEIEWLNEHMAGIFDENEMQVDGFADVVLYANNIIAMSRRFSKPQGSYVGRLRGLLGSLTRENREWYASARVS
jgi:hypothetical protein